MWTCGIDIATQQLTPAMISTICSAAGDIPNGRDDIVNASIGLKLRMDSGTTGVLNLILPVNRGGLRANAIWTLGLEYNF